jgi:hypothetical protein
MNKEDLNKKFPLDETHTAVPKEDAIGKAIICQDNVLRIVEKIEDCHGDWSCFLINASDKKEEPKGIVLPLLKTVKKYKKKRNRK